ncbi:MAG: DUF3455 domain-containing protein [Chitinophagales bacterium]|nr:DUF3455 domain-containing protein [Chitinophagales bacterium]
MKTQFSKTKTIGTIMLMALFALAITSCQKENIIPDEFNNDPIVEAKVIETPVVPDIIAVPAGNHPIWHCYATGVQIYKVTQSTVDPNLYLWSFVAPSATLYNNASYTKKVGDHYVGPTWAATAGKKAGEYVVGIKLQAITQDVTAIPWLLLSAAPSTDPNYYYDVTYIQRINTVGGLAPTTGADAAHLGEESDVPYTAEYYFYGAD